MNIAYCALRSARSSSSNSSSSSSSSSNNAPNCSNNITNSSSGSAYVNVGAPNSSHGSTGTAFRPRTHRRSAVAPPNRQAPSTPNQGSVFDPVQTSNSNSSSSSSSGCIRSNPFPQSLFSAVPPTIADPHPHTTAPFSTLNHTPSTRSHAERAEHSGLWGPSEANGSNRAAVVWAEEHAPCSVHVVSMGQLRAVAVEVARATRQVAQPGVLVWGGIGGCGCGLVGGYVGVGVWVCVWGYGLPGVNVFEGCEWGGVWVWLCRRWPS
jgi:hypothetical protein